jgi:Flp pilus assembly protein TadG
LNHEQQADSVGFGDLVRGWPKDRIGRNSRAWRKDIRGSAATEFAFIVGFMAIGMMNVADIASFMFDKLQVNNATQMAAQAVWTACDLNHLPAATKCPAMTTVATAAVQSTSLGSSVAFQTGYPLDAYYCPDSSGTLQYVSDYANPPSNCSVTGNAGITPGEFVNIQTTYTYTPIISGLSASALLPATITSSSWARLH